MIPETDIILRLVVAAVLGTMIGYERERQDQPAGLRTHMILVVGAALAMTLSINLAMQYREFAPNGDPARLAAQVISGIGFLGAGAILRYGTNIKGLTTATSLWTMAVVGLAVGAGYFLAAVSATVLLLIILTVINLIEKSAISTYGMVHVTLSGNDRPGLIDEVRDLFKLRKRSVYSFSLERDLDRSTVELDFMVKMKPTESIDKLVDDLTAIDGTRRVKIEE